VESQCQDVLAGEGHSALLAPILQNSHFTRGKVVIEESFGQLQHVALEELALAVVYPRNYAEILQSFGKLHHGNISIVFGVEEGEAIVIQELKGS